MVRAVQSTAMLDTKVRQDYRHGGFDSIRFMADRAMGFFFVGATDRGFRGERALTSGVACSSGSWGPGV